jgi:hypothetical protein
MKNALLFLCVLMLSLSIKAQISFTNASFLMNNSGITSGVAMGVVDLNGDGLDDLVRLNNARNLVIGYQKADGTQFQHFTTTFSSGSQWAMAVADVDENGYNDIFVGGAYNGLRIVYFDSSGIDTILSLNNNNVFAQASNFADINNDGNIDLFVCHDDGVSAPFENNGSGILSYNLSLIETYSTIPSDNSGNYGSVWTDYDSDGDLDMYLSKCRLSVGDTLDGRRVNMLFENDGNNNYTDVGVQRKIVPYAQSWAADFADIDNDGDMDAFVVNHDKISTIYENLDNVEFQNITAASGIVSQLNNYDTGIQVKFADFDNDGWIDILVSGDDGFYLFKNNGDKTFSNANPFPGGTPNIHSIGVGDLNNDGFMDVLAGFANNYNSPSSTPDRMFFNVGNENNYFKLILKGKQSNINGIGARVELYSNGVKQIREVRSGEGYGMMNSLTSHFGIGTATVIDSVVVRWPSGVVDVICLPEINTTKWLSEGCLSTCEGIQNTITEQICAGDSILFDGQYLFDSGNYSAIFTTSGACDSTVHLELTKFEVDNSISFSSAGPLTITANAASATFQWYDCLSDEIVELETSSTFVPETSGNYAVIVTQNDCIDTSECYNAIISNTFSNSFDFSVNVFPNPAKEMVNVLLGQPTSSVLVELVDTKGSVQLKQTITNTNGFTLDLKSLPAGVYIIHLTIDGATGMSKLIKY